MSLVSLLFESDTDIEVLELLSYMDSFSSTDSSDKENDENSAESSDRNDNSLFENDEQETFSQNTHFWRVNYMQSLEDAEFLIKFRLSKTAVNDLLTEIMPFLQLISLKNHTVTPLNQVLMTLRYYAIGTVLISIMEFANVTKATASRIIYDISTAISKLHDKYISTQQIGMHSVVKFYRIAGFPKVLGVIGCTHVHIESHHYSFSEEFLNTNGDFSLNVQAVCDADLKFINIVTQSPGSTSEAEIFNNSTLKADLNSGTYKNCWLLGDSAYPSRKYLLTPIIDPVTDAQEKYNEAHSKTRITIERAFAAWKCRFPIVGMPIRLSLPAIRSVILATAVLHNICVESRIEAVPPEVDISKTDIIGRPYSGHNTEDIDIRMPLVDNFFS